MFILCFSFKNKFEVVFEHSNSFTITCSSHLNFDEKNTSSSWFSDISLKEKKTEEKKMQQIWLNQNQLVKIRVNNS